MKVTLVILGCLAVAAAANVHKNVSSVDKDFLAKQDFLFKILYNINGPLMFEDCIKLAKMDNDKSKYTDYTQYMDDFYVAFQAGGLLPQQEFFSIATSEHLKQGKGLFEFFYYAKDWETFMHNVAWARVHVNGGMFVYALTLAVIHRPDMKSLILPSIYEIFPQMFFTSKFIIHAQKFDFDVWNRQIMLEKEFKTILNEDHSSKYFGNHFYVKDWKVWQWWKLMGLDEDWHLEEKTLFRNNIEVFKNDPKYKDIWTDVKTFWYPVDYTRDIEIFNKETKLSYFTEDLGWNAHWYYFNMYYPYNFNGKEFGINKDRSGEFWLYNVQQLLARYYMERYTNGLDAVEAISLNKPYEAGYDPQMIAYNGNRFTFRKNYFELMSYQNNKFLDNMQYNAYRIVNGIESGKYVMKNGVEIDLKKPEAIKYIGSLLQDYFAKFTGNHHVMKNYESMLRDPMFYSMANAVMEIYYKFEGQFPPYNHTELLFPGVKINDVEVSKLKTYFDLHDTDVSNLLNDKMVFHDGKFVWDKTLLARQLRLNHKPFEFDFKVTSDKIQKVVIRTYLAPDFDQYGQKIDLLAHREYFMKLDEFTYDLVVGENIFKRFSKDFHYSKDQTTYTELYKYVMLAYEGKQEFPMEISQPHCSFPDRLILPHGSAEGLPMKLFFFIYPYTAKHEQFSTFDYKYSCGIGSGNRYIDDLPFGYPLDRKIENYEKFFVPNMYFKDVNIYHADKFAKYYPNKYEHFGTFDYAY